MIWKTASRTAGTGRFLRRGSPFPKAKPLPCNFRLCRKAARVKIGEGGWRRSIRRTLRFRQRRGCHAQIEHLGHGTRRGRYPRPPACQKPQDGARRAGALPRVHHPRVRMAGAGGFLRRGKAVPLLPPPGNPHVSAGAGGMAMAGRRHPVRPLAKNLLDTAGRAMADRAPGKPASHGHGLTANGTGMGAGRRLQVQLAQKAEIAAGPIPIGGGNFAVEGFVSAKNCHRRQRDGSFLQRRFRLG